MSKNLAAGLAWLATKKFSEDGIPITYSRDTTDLSISAVQGKAIWESDNGAGVIVREESPDWFVSASDIVSLSQPQPGDRITCGLLVFEVMIESNGSSPWQWAAWPARSVYRIHTKQVT